MATRTRAGSPRAASAETAAGTSGAYPDAWEFDAVLSDGETVHIRPISPEDGKALEAFHDGLSPETVYLRFFTSYPHLRPADVARFTHVDYVDRMALVAELAGDLVAIARYDRAPGATEAEVAFVVADAQQGRGLGTLLLEHLASRARQCGIRRFVADTLATNAKMLGVFQDAGFRTERHLEQGVVHVVFPIEPTEASVSAMEERERRAELRSMERLLRPRSIAVVGAGRSPNTIGHELFRNLLRPGFEGTAYPVNRAADHVAGVRAYASVAAVPDEVDIAVIAVPAAEVPLVVQECAEAGVKALVVVSAGFAETGRQGAEAQRELVRIARRHGMRLVGPNCLGVANAAANVRMNATFAPVTPLPGNVAFLSQSGALGIAALEQASSLGLGLSSFVSVGNKADVSGNDLLEYWESDPATEVILLYLESFGNPRKFARIAQRVSRFKPIVAVKSGRTETGGRAAQSHTASAASPDVAVDALFRQAGVIRVDTMGELFDVARLLAHQPLPAGPRLAVVGNSGGPGILAADACEPAGLELPELSPATEAALRAFLPVGAAVANPVDLVASATPDDYERALGLVLDDGAVDAVLAIFTPPLVTSSAEVAAAVARAGGQASKPVAANFLDPAVGYLLRDPDASARAVPVYRFPEEAVRALGRAAALAHWRARPLGTRATPSGTDLTSASELVQAALRRDTDGGWLEPGSATRLLECFGIPVATTAVVRSAAAAVRAAEEVGYPVALKANAAGLVHKSDVGGVQLDLGSAGAVRTAWRTLRASLGDSLEGALVQPMASAPGVETIVGVVQDPLFGPIVLFGLGGVATDLLADRCFRILPVSDVDASEMIHGVRASPLLTGYRGARPVDIAALREVIVRVAHLAETVPEVVEMDLNPVLAAETSALVLDAKVRVAPRAGGPEPTSRRLRAPT